MNRLSVDCDYDGNPSEPDMHGIGILSSNDPVADKIEFLIHPVTKPIFKK